VEPSLKASAIIRLSLEDGPLIQVKGITDAIIIWNRLRTLYEPKGFSSEFLLSKELFSTTLAKQGYSMEGYLTRITRLTSDLAARGLIIPNKVIAAYTLSNLSSEYEYTVAIISQSFRGIPTSQDIDLIELFGQLVDESRRQKGKEPQEVAMASGTKPINATSKKCSFCHKGGHSVEKCWKKHPEQKPQKGQLAKGSGSKQNEEISLNTEEEYALSSFSDYMNPSTWLLDSGASRHITAYKENFISLEPCSIRLNWGKASNLRVNWQGKVKIRLENKVITLDNCLYAPEIGINLLSMGQLAQKGVNFQIDKEICYLLINGKFITKGLYERGLILIKGRPITTQQEEYANPGITTENIWHHRMGHIGNTALQALPKATNGIDETIQQVQNCETCLQAKMTTKISREPMERAKEILDKVHSDICGPITPETLSKRRYMASFIDDKTRWADIALLRTRDQLFSQFKEWLVREQNQQGTILKRLHSDNAKEYKSHEFQELFKSQGTIGTYSAPYNPQQNGISEIFNRTLFNKVRALLFATGLPKTLWGEAALAAVYLYNRTPHTSLEGFITPYEAKYGEQPDISNIRTWGSITYKKEPNELIKKLDARANPYILIGYGSNQYKLIKPGGKIAIWARDVEILENSFIKNQPEKISAKLAEITSYLSNTDSIPLEITNDEGQLVDNNDNSDNSTEDWLQKFTQQLQDAALEEGELVLLASDPTYEEALKSPEKPKWDTAINAEYNDLLTNNTWDLVPRTQDIKVIKGKWVLKVKPPLDNPIYKARWVAKGFLQEYGIDFNETFANTVNPIAWRLIIAIVAYLNWEIDHWDVKLAFTNAKLNEEVYIEQPIGFEDSERPDWVCKLNRALYGLKQSPREWENHLRGLLAKRGFYPLKSEQSIYINKDGTTILIIYVDDILAISLKRDNITSLFTSLSEAIKIKDLGPISTFLGIEFNRNRGDKSIRLSQKAYIDKILKRFNYSVKTKGKIYPPISQGIKIEPNEGQATLTDIKDFQQQIGALLYLNTKTRPDLAYSVGCLARYMSNPSLQHFKLLKKVWYYLEKTSDLGLLYHSDPSTLLGYTDADWGGDIATRRSTTGYIFLFRGSPISWQSKLQKTVALSSCEAEYMALKEAIKEQQYIKAILDEIGLPIIIESTTLYTDSNSAAELAKNPVYHARTKHIDIQYHYIRECIQTNLTKLNWIATEYQLADSLTKAISSDKWLKFIDGIGLSKN